MTDGTVPDEGDPWTGWTGPPDEAPQVGERITFELNLFGREVTGAGRIMSYGLRDNELCAVVELDEVPDGGLVLGASSQGMVSLDETGAVWMLDTQGAVTTLPASVWLPLHRML